MRYLMALLGSAVVFVFLIGAGGSARVWANANQYPQFAQHQIDPAISITFVKVDEVKKRLDDGTPQLLVDVRMPDEYAQGHLPRAVSIPLGVLSVRMAEIPRTLPVVLY